MSGVRNSKKIITCKLFITCSISRVVMWVPKMQTQIALSTMEAKHIALSQSMRNLIPIREVLKEIMTIVFDHDHDHDHNVVYHSHSKARVDEAQEHSAVHCLRR